MFVFPALDSNFKSRKRTFRCCKACRSKRTKCDITGVNFEVEGCANCRKHGWPCTFIKADTTQGEPPSHLESPKETKIRDEMVPLDMREIKIRDDTVPLDMREVNIHYLKEKFNFNTSALHSDSAYQYVYHEHPVAIISANADDNTVWHQSGVFVDLDPNNSNSYKVQGFGGRQITNYIANRNTYKFLLLIHAFTLSSPEFDFTADEITTLVKTYFFKINSVFPIVHEKRFWTDYHANRPNSCMMYAMVLAILRDKMVESLLKQVFLRSKNQLSGFQRTLQEYSNAEFAGDFTNFLDELETKIRQINLILPKLGDVDKLTKLVVQLLLSMHYRSDRLGNEQSSHDLTAALNLGFSLAIHMKPVDGRISKEKEEYCKNLWWCCFIFDRFNAVTNCRCLFMRHEDFNIDLPYSNLNLLRMVQLARVFENMLVAVYRPFDNIHMKNLNNDVKSRLEIFNVDEFRNFEFDFCDKEIASGTSVYLPSPNTDNLQRDLPNYVSNITKLMTRVVNNLVVLVSQKIRFENPAIDNLIPRKAMIKAAANILWYIKQMDEELVINIPLITWALSLTMAAYLKVRAKSIMNGKPLLELEDIIPQYLLEDFLSELEKYKSKWWIVQEIVNLTNDFIAKLELSSKKVADNEFALPPSKRIKVEPGIETESTDSSTPVYNLPRTPSLPSIQNIINAREASQSTAVDVFSGWDIARTITNEYDRYIESMHVDIFDNEFFKDVPNVINTL